MPLSQLNRRRFCHIVGIIPGPKEPVKIDPYLENLLEEFKQYGPAGEYGHEAVGICQQVGATAEILGTKHLLAVAMHVRHVGDSHHTNC